MSATEAVRAATAKCGSDPGNVEQLGGALDDYSDTALNRTLQDISDADAEAPSEIEAARLQYFASRIHALGERTLFCLRTCYGRESYLRRRERHWEGPEMKGPLEIVLEYIDRHWAPIPVPFKEKNPRITAWQKQRITRETAGQYFNSAAQNIGVILGPASGGLTDIDLDCSEAIGLASYFLPRTGAPELDGRLCGCREYRGYSIIYSGRRFLHFHFFVRQTDARRVDQSIPAEG